MADTPETPHRLRRREALSTIAFWGATVGAVGAIGLPAARFAVGDSLKEAEQHWVTVGSLDKLPVGDYKQISYQYRTKDAWHEVTREGILYARVGEDGQPVAISAVCTHLGCNVRWRSDESRFACPCHSGFYDADGEVISGPPPKRLERLETRVTNGILEAHI